MRWLLGLPLIPLILCGGMCLGGALVAFVLGRSPKNETNNNGEEVGVGRG